MWYFIIDVESTIVDCYILIDLNHSGWFAKIFNNEISTSQIISALPISMLELLFLLTNPYNYYFVTYLWVSNFADCKTWIFKVQLRIIFLTYFNMQNNNINNNCMKYFFFPESLLDIKK